MQEPGPELDVDLTASPLSGRTFSTSRTVSIADAGADGRMDFDAIARFLQDAGNDDTDDAGFAQLGLAWIARRAVIEVRQHARAREQLGIVTWCSATGAKWAQRRTSVVGDGGAQIEAAAVWVHIDPVTGRPLRWTDEFAATYLEAAAGRHVSTRLQHPKTPPPIGGPNVNTMPWKFRRSDLDQFGHVNNAAYLAILEESLGGNLGDSPVRIEMEWRKPSNAGEDLLVVEQIGNEGVMLWIMAEEGELRTTIAGTLLGSAPKD